MDRGRADSRHRNEGAVRDGASETGTQPIVGFAQQCLAPVFAAGDGQLWAVSSLV